MADLKRSCCAMERGEGPSERRLIALCLLVSLGIAVGLSFCRLGASPLLDPDEPRYAQAAREMRRDHDWLVPHFSGMPRLVKPPLFYWLVAGAQELFGETEWAARLWPAMLGVGTVGLTFLLGLETVGWRAALLGALVLGTTPLFVGLSRLAVPDMAQAFLLTGAYLVFWRLARGRGRQSLAFLFLLILGVAGWLKSPFIPLLSLLVAVVFSAVGRRWRPWRAFATPAGILGIVAFAALSVGWQVSVGLREAKASDVFVQQTLERFLAGGDHPEPFWYHAAALPLVFLPWTFFAPLALLGLRRSCEGGRSAGGRLFLVAWLCVAFVLLTASKGKLVSYLLPLLPPLALLTGWGIDLAVQPAGGRTGRAGMGTALALVLALWVGLLVAGAGFGAVIPAVPAVSFVVFVSVAAGCAIAGLLWWWKRPGAAAAAWVVGGLLVVYCGLLEVQAPLLISSGSSAALVQQVRPWVRPDTRLLSYKSLPTGLVYYLDRPISDFSNTQKLRRALPEHGSYLIFARRRFLSELELELGVDLAIVAESGSAASKKDLLALAPREMADPTGSATTTPQRATAADPAAELPALKPQGRP